jgi:ribonuclease HI
VAVVDGEHFAQSGGELETTNNRMELRAAIAGLRFVQKRGARGPVAVTTDSQYVKQGITDWIRRWERNGWLTAAKKPVKNRDLWQQLGELDREMRPRWAWVRGHAGHRYNEECDRMVRSRIREMS